MAKKKASAKKKVAKKAAPAPAPEPAAAIVRGDGAGLAWEWEARKSGGGELRADSGSRDISAAFNFGFPVSLVRASIGGEEIAPKVAGAQVFVRCGGGTLVLDVEPAQVDSSGVSVAPWEP